MARHCGACRRDLLQSLQDAFISSRPVAIALRRPARFHVGQVPVYPQRRSVSYSPRLYNEHESVQAKSDTYTPSLNADHAPETMARHARQTFGETLPMSLLSDDEFKIYERMYGMPSAKTSDEDLISLGKTPGEQDNVDESSRSLLMTTDNDGKLEEVIFEDDLEEQSHDESSARDDDATAPDLNRLAASKDDPLAANSLQAFKDRVENLRLAAVARQPELKEEPKDFAEAADDAVLEGAQDADQEDNIEATAITSDEQPQDEQESEQGFEQEHESPLQDSESETDAQRIPRAHPFTTMGLWGPSPSTLHLPKDTMLAPTKEALGDCSNKQLLGAALKAFGGPGLPRSTTVIKGPNQKQMPLGLEAIEPHMGQMEANAFLAILMPGIYSASMSTLIEVRKRLGSDWLPNLLRKDSRILDVGGGGAAVLAWREMLRATWNSMHPEGVPPEVPIPYGKATVVTGSDALRHRASHLLVDTSFIPRLPDYNRERDDPGMDRKNPQPRKKYDVIIAPHTLWHMKEEYMRKQQVQNLWSLLKPKGGVLILIEKGVPRGFETIAAAREQLLRYHIASPGAEHLDPALDDVSNARFLRKETGMIIAPCTNHASCPMHINNGASQGRKDLCHFSQRYIRPPYLQNVLGARHQNHEDVKFSFIAVQRGIDQRREQRFEQGDTATNAAFAGFDDKNKKSAHKHNSHKIIHDETLPPTPPPNPMSLPRAILPAIKSDGHVTLDLCTPSGQLERWTVPRSFSRQAYRDARKSQWGDLWALGAKTRVQKFARAGTKKYDMNDMTDEQFTRLVSEPSTDVKGDKMLGKKTKNGRSQVKPRKARIVSERKVKHKGRPMAEPALFEKPERAVK